MRTIRVLILEDDPRKFRMKAFKERFAELYDQKRAHVQWKHVEHASECIEALRSESFDIIFLDHDLGGEEMVDHRSVEDCGMRVAEYFRDEPLARQRHGLVIIHSSNVVAAPIMNKMIIGSHWIKGVYFRKIWNKSIRIDP